jgi:hypothetical protein
MGVQRDARPFTHFLFRNWFEFFRWFCVHSRVSWDLSSFRQDAAATDAKRRPGFQTSTLEACAPRTLRLRVNFCAALDEFFPFFLH